MLSRALASLLVLLSVSSAAGAQQAAAPSNPQANPLPVTRVVLYKNGVGYFQHAATVKGSENLTLDFTTSQLNDVLKSLTAVDLDGGHITGMRFNSVAPLAQRLRALHLPIAEEASRLQLLQALRGTPVSVHAGSAATTGRVLSVEQVKKLDAKTGLSETVVVLSLITGAGDLRSVEITPGVSVHIADRELDRKLGEYLRLIGSAVATDVRRMTISDQGTGERHLLVGYISEVPVWKSTYRMLLPTKSGGKPLLQGWAIVDNTLGEDWNHVHLSLVAGAPQSFVENISVPYYVRRPVVPLPQSVMLTPQAHEAALLNSPVHIPSGAVGVVGGVPGGMPGGSVGGVLGGILSSSAPPTPPPPTINAEEAEASNPAQAKGAPRGVMFEYRIQRPVTLGKNQSALVPILQARVDAEKVTLWNQKDMTPLRALWLTNTSGETLDGGSMDVFEGGTFAGEALLDAIRPGERRLISYAADPAVQVVERRLSTREPISRVHIAKGLMLITREERSASTFDISNSGSRRREVIIEHPVRQGWRLSGSAKPAETTASYYRFKVPVGARASVKLHVAEVHPQSNSLELTNLTSDYVAYLEKQKGTTPELEAAFRKILARKNVLSQIEVQIETRRHEVSTIASDQQRIRENMKVLKGGEEEKALLRRYTGELNSQEDRLTALRGQIAELKSKQQAEQDRLNDMLSKMTFDVTF